jgi:hypothetical protein
MGSFMKDLKQYQNRIWFNSFLEHQFDNLNERVNRSESAVAGFFSAIITSIIINIATSIFVEEIDDAKINVILKLLIFIVIFIFLSKIIKSFILPLWNKCQNGRRTTVIKQSEVEEVVTRFNTNIVYSVIEMYDAIPVLTNKPQAPDAKCKLISIIAMAQEFCKCVIYLTTHKSDIIDNMRSSNKTYSDADVCKRINSYTLITTIQLLHIIGKSLKDSAETIENMSEIQLLKNDLAKFVGKLEEFSSCIPQKTTNNPE